MSDAAAALRQGLEAALKSSFTELRRQSEVRAERQLRDRGVRASVAMRGMIGRLLLAARRGGELVYVGARTRN